jgi:hypothetical protein
MEEVDLAAHGYCSRRVLSVPPLGNGVPLVVVFDEVPVEIEDPVLRADLRVRHNLTRIPVKREEPLINVHRVIGDAANLGSDVIHHLPWDGHHAPGFIKGLRLAAAATLLQAVMIFRCMVAISRKNDSRCRFEIATEEGRKKGRRFPSRRTANSRAKRADTMSVRRSFKGREGRRPDRAGAPSRR